MSGARVALFIGCSDYADPRFQHLPAPAQDIDALTRVLVDPAIGDFTVDALLNESSRVVNEKIEEFFADRKPDDLLLLYFSCHGFWTREGGCTSLPPTREESCWAPPGSRRNG